MVRPAMRHEDRQAPQAQVVYRLVDTLASTAARTASSPRILRQRGQRREFGDYRRERVYPAMIGFLLRVG
jgi:hypothetical protein